MPSLPDDFVDLSTAHSSPEGSFRNFIGLVTDILPATITKTGDHMLTAKLLDPALRDAVNNHPLRIRFFRRDPAMLPQIKQLGDIVLIRNIKMGRFMSEPIGISNYQTRALVFPITSIPKTGFYFTELNCLGHPADKSVEPAEKRYIAELRDEMHSTIETLPKPLNITTLGLGPTSGGMLPPPKPQPQSSSTFGHKFMLVKDLRHKKFADICGEVVKNFPGQYGNELYITDYTENKEMFFYQPPEMPTGDDRDGDDYGYITGPKKEWPGPYGWLVLKVNTREPHSSFARSSVQEGDIILLKNVKMKIMATGTRLEGDMWPDDKNPDRVGIQKPKDIMETKEVKAMLERKERYWEARRTKTATNEKKKGGRNERKNAKKKQKKKAGKAATANELDEIDEDNAAEEAAEKDTEKPAAKPAAVINTSKNTLNANIRCCHKEIPISSVKTILDLDNNIHTHKMPNGQTKVLPFVNAKYRARVRVIDFEPKQLEDFVLPSDDPALGPQTNPDSSQTHEWAFSLRLEDATRARSATKEDTDTIWVTLHHEEAQYLFGNNVGDPTDLRTGQSLLAKMKQQLFLLWGNLEEKQEGEELSNRPFECCLMEYGIELEDDDPERATSPFGWKRFYAMFGTTIA